MTEQQLKNKLDELRALPAETEWAEFKSASRDFHFDSVGKYFSALSNEANLKEKEDGWLIFGVEDKHRTVIGTNYRPSRAHLDSLKSEIANKTTGRITFTEIYELTLPEGRVVMFQIPPAPQGIPVAWEGHYYGRDNEELGALNIQEIETIRSQAKNYDWSAQIVEGATLDDLEPEAIAFARKKYGERSRNADEVAQWDDPTFLNKAYLTKQGKITNAAILLLGKPESKHFIEPAFPLITWVLRDVGNMDLGYEHFFPPFLLATDKLYAKIRNLKYVYLPDNTLFPTEVDMYDPFLIRESLHNCIAHQDYELGRRINVVEFPNELIFTNAGSFIPGSIEKVIELDSPPDRYRNPFLANAMTNLNMIEIRGGGIRKMFTIQRNRFFPMPDYDFSQADSVRVKIFGKILDENYTKLLMNRSDLSLRTVILLDFVQKRKTEWLTDEQVSYLKLEKLVEGRKPKYFVSAMIAQLTDEKARYTRNKAFDKKYYMDLIESFLKQHGSATRKEIDELILDKLPDFMDSKQRFGKIHNILSAMVKKGRIENTGLKSKPKWIFKK
ncbi:MAG: transcriptional regulator [Saprospiraceae bacterium]|nr:MAG: transcriptional regulator [Saprospiraceae bacterium]